MAESTLLSVVIPMYNGKQFIRSTVEAALKINHQKEILIIDDGSTDDSFEYCNELWKDNSQIAIYQKANGGIVDARNYGMSCAKGKYIIFVDHDDIVVPDVVDKAINMAELECTDIVFWSTERLLNSGEKIKCGTVYKDVKLEDEQIKVYLLKEMLTNRNNRTISYIGHVWAALYRTAFVKQNNYKFKRYVNIEDDYLFVFNCLTGAKKVLCISDVGYYWSYNEKSETYRMKYIPDIIQKYEKLYEYLLTSVKAVCNIEDVKRDYIKYIKQEVLIFGTENCFTCINKNHNEKKQLNNLIKLNHDAFIGDCLIRQTSRRRRIFKLFKWRCYGIAYAYIYMDSLYRKLRGKNK